MYLIYAVPIVNISDTWTDLPRGTRHVMRKMAAAAGCLWRKALFPARRRLLSIRCSSFTHEIPSISEEVGAKDKVREWCLDGLTIDTL